LKEGKKNAELKEGDRCPEKPGNVREFDRG